MPDSKKISMFEITAADAHRGPPGFQHVVEIDLGNRILTLYSNSAIQRDMFANYIDKALILQTQIQHFY